MQYTCIYYDTNTIIKACAAANNVTNARKAVLRARIKATKAQNDVNTTAEAVIKTHNASIEAAQNATKAQRNANITAEAAQKAYNTFLDAFHIIDKVDIVNANAATEAANKLHCIVTTTNDTAYSAHNASLNAVRKAITSNSVAHAAAKTAYTAMEAAYVANWSVYICDITYTEATHLYECIKAKINNATT